MRISTIPAFGVAAALLGATFHATPLQAQSGVFTVQIGAPPLVRHGDLWRYRKSFTAPPTNWQTLSEAALDAEWLSGPGGIGMGDPDGDDVTSVTDMLNNYTCLYLRQSFAVATPIEPSRRLELVMDYDDGFIAYLDGAEVTRSPNVPGAVGSIFPYNQGLGQPNNHEALGYRGLPPEIYDLGPVGSRLSPGTHVLAIQVINGTLDSSDLTLIADLRLTGNQDVVADGAFSSVAVVTNVLLTGSNTVAGSTRVVVNGRDATFAPGSGAWSRVQPLVPGMNRLFIAALDANGAILSSVSRDVVAEVASTGVGGVLAGSTSWSPALGSIRVTNDLVVPAGATLTIDPGTVVLLAPSASIRATGTGTVTAQGTAEQPVYFLPADGTTTWGELSANAGTLTLRFAEVVNGQVRALANSVVTVEDSVLRDYTRPGVLFVSAASAQQMTLRRTHIARYDQCRFSASPILIEDCLIEQIGSDATDFADHPDVVVRRTTYRFGTGGGTDAIDNGGNPGMRVESCLIHDFPDKGVSIAALSHGTTVRHSLIYNTTFGISVYSASNCVFEQNTLVGNTSGIAAYVRSGFPGPGLAAATNNIIWGNATNIFLASGGRVTAAYCDIGGTNWPGPGNLNLDPLFQNPARHDYRLSPDSPLRFSGFGDLDLGALFPVGGIPPAPFNLAAQTPGTNAIELGWQEDADNEAGFEIQRSPDATTWMILANVDANATTFADATAQMAQLYFYRVRATNTSGLSRFSNLASAVGPAPVLIAGGTLSADTTWSPAAGSVLVTAPLIVPAGVTLTIEAGTLVRLTNGAGIRAAAGGTIEVLGAAGEPVQFIGANPTANWGGLSASGAGASLVVRHAELRGGCVGATNSATMLLEDTYLHDYKNGGYAIGGCENATVTLRRCHFAYYHETLWRSSLVVIEDTLFEYSDNPNSDALDFDGVLPGSIIRRCTFRHGPEFNTDAIDVGPNGGDHSIGVAIVDSLMYDFPHDGGISAGEGVWGLTVSNCLIYGCRGAIKCKETPSQPTNPTTMSVYQCTFVDNLVAGYSNYVKSCGTCLAGQITNSFNNIIYGNPIDIVLLGQGVLTADHTLFGSTNVVGNGTFNVGAGVFTANPLFINPAMRDYRLQSTSPALAAGRDGAPLGCHFPVGAPMASSHPQIQSLAMNGGSVTVQFWADSEKAYTLQSCETLANPVWNTVTNLLTRPLPERIVITRPRAAGNQYFRLTSP